MKLIPRSGRRTVICAAGLAMALVFPLYAFAGDAPEWLSPRLRDHPLAGAIVNAQGEKVPESDNGVRVPYYSSSAEWRHDESDFNGR